MATHLAADCPVDDLRRCPAKPYWTPVQRECANCGQMMHCARSDCRTCSPRCRQAVSRRKRRAKLAAEAES